MKTQAFRVLAAGDFPAHRTIRDFRAQHLVEFTESQLESQPNSRRTCLTKPSQASSTRSNTSSNPRSPP